LHSLVYMHRQCSLLIQTSILGIVLNVFCGYAREVGSIQLSLGHDGSLSQTKFGDGESASPENSNSSDNEEVEESDWGTPPIIGDYTPDTTVIWNGTSQIPVFLQTLVALVWVTMVASLPLVIIKFEGNAITRAQLGLFGVMWVSFLGGIYLFTQIILFQSIHFKQIRSLTIVEAVYFLSQILTTVGYGDITPAKPRGQVFVGLYVLFSLFVIATVLSETSVLIAQSTKKYMDQMEKAIAQLKSITNQSPAEMQDPESARGVANAAAVFKASPPTLHYDKIIQSFTMYFALVWVGVAFFTLFPGEGKTLFQAIYMSIITLSTVGFGAFTPVTETGLVFSAFWMLFGSMSLISVVGSFTQLHEQIKIRERWDPKNIEDEKQAFLNALPAEPDKLDVLKHYILQKGFLSHSEMDAIDNFCKKLNPDRTGAIQKTSLEKIWSQGGV